ncbi:MAG: ABC transporter ATP-binding protein, partial [Candidatus Saganbacteria bacterium]|nr:ABC transporter ATP-binding protein [Candidatus Saganbacteria bacterium]
RLLTAVMEPTSGSATVAGFDILKEDERIKGRIGYMPQAGLLYEQLTVDENINFFAEIHQVKRSIRDERKEMLLEFSRLSPFRRRLAGNLSGGMKKKLSLSCALIHTPEILFLDEPTTGVDPVSRREFWRILYGLGGVTILLNTPYMDEAERCGRVGLIYEGAIKLVETPEKIKSYFKGELLEIKCSFLRGAKRILRKLPTVLGVDIFGNTLHVVVRNLERDRSEIMQELRQKDILVEGARKIYPSLEDVFISLIKA